MKRKSKKMKKSIKDADVLTKKEQKQIQGGFFGDRGDRPACNDPYYDPTLAAGDACQPGFFMHPQTVGICCRYV